MLLYEPTSKCQELEIGSDEILMQSRKICQKTDFRRLIKFHKLLKLNLSRVCFFLNLDLNAIHVSPLQNNCSKFIMGCTTSFRVNLHQKLASTTLKMIL